MSFLDWLLGNDHERAATRYAGRESASSKAARNRRASHRKNGAARAARAAEKWEAADRRRFKA